MAACGWMEEESRGGSDDSAHQECDDMAEGDWLACVAHRRHAKSSRGGRDDVAEHGWLAWVSHGGRAESACARVLTRGKA